MDKKTVAAIEIMPFRAAWLACLLGAGVAELEAHYNEVLAGGKGVMLRRIESLHGRAFPSFCA